MRRSLHLVLLLQKIGRCLPYGVILSPSLVLIFLCLDRFGLHHLPCAQNHIPRLLIELGKCPTKALANQNCERFIGDLDFVSGEIISPSIRYFAEAGGFIKEFAFATISS